MSSIDEERANPVGWPVEYVQVGFPPRPGRQSHTPQLNPVGPHADAEDPPLRDPVSMLMDEKLRAALSEPHASQLGFTPSE